MSVATLTAVGLAALLAPSAPAAPPLGDGGRFALVLDGGEEAEVTIITGTDGKGRRWAEYATGAGLGTLHQHVVLDAAAGRPVRVVEGYILVPPMTVAERLPSELLTGDGLDLAPFLTGRASDLQAMRLGEEEVDTPAGRVRATRYRQAQGERSVEFWLAEEAAPLGLVKLASRGSKPGQSYTLELKALVRNARPVIAPVKAVPLSPQTRQLLDRRPPLL